jgi:hypothetical protein
MTSVEGATAPVSGASNVRRIVGFLAFAALNLGVSLAFTLPRPHNGDWRLWIKLPEAIATGTIYATQPPWCSLELATRYRARPRASVPAREAP